MLLHPLPFPLPQDQEPALSHGSFSPPQSWEIYGPQNCTWAAKRFIYIKNQAPGDHCSCQGTYECTYSWFYLLICLFWTSTKLKQNRQHNRWRAWHSFSHMLNSLGTAQQILFIKLWSATNFFGGFLISVRHLSSGFALLQITFFFTMTGLPSKYLIPSWFCNLDFLNHSA